MDVSIVILNYKSKGLVAQCIKTIELSASTCSYEIIVVDNASGDGIGAMLEARFPRVRFIAAGDNRGYASGNNLGIRAASGKYVLIMNPDITPHEGSIDALVKYMNQNPTIGVCGPKLLKPNGQIDESCYRFHNVLTPIYRRTPLGRLQAGQQENGRYVMQDFDRQQTRDVDWLLGAVLMVRRSALDRVGLLDEKYFLYFEDTDWCRRFWAAGWRVSYFIGSTMVHCHERASAKTSLLLSPLNRAARTHVRSCVYYFRKWGTDPVSYEDIKEG
ncbi:MAG: glycosyltransferase family 2 protein [Patescibacteria group bacterium]